MQPPDITRVFKGPQNDFEVKIVFAREGNRSPRRGTPMMKPCFVNYLRNIIY
jgi:hypothetical protein